MVGLIRRAESGRGRSRNVETAPARRLAGGRADSWRAARRRREANRQLRHVRGHYGKDPRRGSPAARRREIPPNFRERRRGLFRIDAGRTICDRESGHGAHRGLLLARGDDQRDSRHRQAALRRSGDAQGREAKAGRGRHPARLRVPHAAQGWQQDLDFDEHSGHARRQRQDRHPRWHGGRHYGAQTVRSRAAGHHGDHSRRQRHGQSG